MPPRRPLIVIAASVVLGVGLTTTLAACSSGDDPSPAPSRSASSTRTPSATTTAPATTGAPAPVDSTEPSPSTPDVPSDDQTGGQDDGTGPGTGNGSGVDTPTTVDWSAISEQGVAAAGGGTVVSIIGAGDEWTVLVAGPDGSQTQSVVSATLGRVTSGPFPKDADAATKTANVARSAAARIDAATAAASATKAVAGGSLTSLVLGGSGSAPVWTATLSTSGGSRTVTVDAVSGAVRA
jgi:hypothetical protein